MKTISEEFENLRESLNKALYVLRFTIHSETKETPFELNFGREPGTKLFHLKNAVSVDSKDLSVYITRDSAGEVTDHLVMSKKNKQPEILERNDFYGKQKNVKYGK